MASEKLGMVPPQQIHNGLNPHPQLVFSEAFACAPHPPHRRPTSTCDSGPKAATREFTACFLDHHHFFQPQPQPQPQQPPPPPPQFRGQWNISSRNSGGDGSEDDDAEDENDDEEEDEDDDDDFDVENNTENIVNVSRTCDSNKKDIYRANTDSHKMKHLSALGLKDSSMTQSGNEFNNGSNRDGGVRNSNGGEMYYSQYLNGEGPSSSSGHKEMAASEGFRGSKEGSFLSESGESLRAILSDPLTGTLMEDAMILPCGHSFGTDGIKQIIRMKICYTCSQPVLEDSIAPNLSLRLAVQAFMREEELHVNNMAKRRRERYEHKGTYGDSPTDLPRGKGVQFPFAVTDRVIIKGNKRTPQRFVGREAIVTTQCLNGWYVVKTLDNAESVKLQYRSLAKVSTDNPPSKESPIKGTPNWL